MTSKKQRIYDQYLAEQLKEWEKDRFFFCVALYWISVSIISCIAFFAVATSALLSTGVFSVLALIAIVAYMTYPPQW